MSFGTKLAPNLLGDKRDAKVLIEIQFASSPPCKMMTSFDRPSTGF